MQYDCKWLQQHIFKKYSASQSYFYSNTINEITTERRCGINILYEDIEYICDEEENLKRYYLAREYPNKMFTFKEYYFYHEDCPRIFMHGIEKAYAKWQDRKRDFVYKKLKLIYNESYSSRRDDSHQPSRNEEPAHLTHFLMEISDYNPYSKNYYLRVEAKRHKDQKALSQNNKTRRDISNLNHDLSAMLQDFGQISTISQQNSPIQPETNFIQKKTSLSQLKKVSLHTRLNPSQNYMNNSNSLLKFSFKKSKEITPKPVEAKSRRISLKQKDSRQKSKESVNKQSPKFSSIDSEMKLQKTRSIFSVSSFGALQKKSEITIKALNSKRQPLKINYEGKKLSLNKQDQDRHYQSEKKKAKNIVIKSKSSSKIVNSKPLEKLRIRQISVGKLLVRQDEFSDQKMTEALVDQRLRSHKSEFAGIPTKKNLFNVRPNQIQKTRKNTIELRNWRLIQY